MFKKLIATATAVLIGVGLSLVAVAAPASAHTGALTPNAVCQTDGTWKVTWTYHQTNTPGSGSGSEANVIVTTTRTPSDSLIDGAAGQRYINAATGNENANGQTAIPTKKGNFDTTFVQTGIPGSATQAKVQVSTFWVGWSTKADLYSGTVDLTGPCDTPKTPVTVNPGASTTPPTCTAPGTLVIPTQKGIVFSVSPEVTGPGTYTVTAEAAPGYKLDPPYSIKLTVKPADTTKCTVDPKAEVKAEVCTPTQDNKSQKSTTFWFDNSTSQVAVTFTIPSLNITQVVAAGAKVSVDGPKVDHNVGASWPVLANGKALITLTVEKFAPCVTVPIPVSTMSKMECVDFSLTGTYTLPETKWVEWYVNGAPATTPKDVKVPSKVIVDAHINAAGLAAGITFTDGSIVASVTHPFVLPPGGCDGPTLAILYPTASQNNGSCTADPTYTLSNTTSPSGGVQWMIGDPQAKTTPGTHKAAWGSTVVVEATLVNSVKDGFAPESQTEWTFKFPAKPACGDLVTLALTGGSTGGFVPWIAGGLLLLGGAGIYFQRRLVAAKK